MASSPVQIHIIVSHESGRTAERHYLRDEDGWWGMCRWTQGSEVVDDLEYQFGHPNEALMDGLESLRAAFGTMRQDGDAPLPSLIPVDVREPKGTGDMN